LAAFLINVLVTPLILHYAHKYQWYDEHSHRKIHTTDTPRLGGVGIFVAFVLSAITGLVFVLSPAQFDLWSTGSVALIIAGMAVMHGLGIYDDFVNLPAPAKFLVQVLSGGIVAFSGAVLRTVDVPLFGIIELPLWFAIPATVLWIVSIANAVNLIDGADGLAGGFSAIAAFFMGLIALGQGNLLTAIIAFALVGSLIGFLVFNFPPARIFMGDSGSLFLGFVLAVLPLLGLNGRSPTNGPIFAVVPVLTLLYLPITDTLLAIARRRARGLPVHAPDREHIHHRLIDRGFTGKKLLLVIYGGSAIFGITAMAWFTTPRAVGVTLNVTLWVIVTVVVLWLGRSRPPYRE
jgi:UDP-GlcNAc:undecaprenyl-phosphate GlcNAc-1-phosphate transferase